MDKKITVSACHVRGKNKNKRGNQAFSVVGGNLCMSEDFLTIEYNECALLR